MHAVAPVVAHLPGDLAAASSSEPRTQAEAPPKRRGVSLRTALVMELGFITSSAVAMVGLTTVLIAGNDLAELLGPLLALWLGSTTVFVLFGGYAVHRMVIRPLQRLTAEADALTTGQFPAHVPQETAELELLARRYRIMAENLLDAQSQVVRVEKLAGIGRLAAGVAHEVRNPLGALATYIEVLQRRGADPKVTGDMRQAIDRIERIAQGRGLCPARVRQGCRHSASSQHGSEYRGSEGDGLPGGPGNSCGRSGSRSGWTPARPWYQATSTCWNRSSSTWWSMRARPIPEGGWWSVPCPRSW